MSCHPSPGKVVSELREARVSSQAFVRACGGLPQKPAHLCAHSLGKGVCSGSLWSTRGDRVEGEPLLPLSWEGRGLTKKETGN